MVKVPKAILRKKEKLSPEELNQIRTHPIHSYRVISKELKYPEEIGVIALQHHERWDGQGYPRHLRGEDINLAARIVAVADAYIAMINERPHRNSMIGYSAMKNVLSDNGRHFDPRVLKAFLESMGIYPIGSIVQLNNSAIGTGDGDPHRGAAASRGRADHRRVRQQPRRAGDHRPAREEGAVHREGRRPEGSRPRAGSAGGHGGAPGRRSAGDRVDSGARGRGARGEETAAAWLASQGYRILERNFRCRAGEIDIVAERDGAVAFVEVKSWRRMGRADLEYAIGGVEEAAGSPSPRGISCRVIRSSQGGRCDSTSFCSSGGRIEHLENAFGGSVELVVRIAKKTDPKKIAELKRKIHDEEYLLAAIQKIAQDLTKSLEHGD